MQIEEQIQGIDLVLNTNEEVFSPTAVDKGTKAMLSFVEFKEGDKVLDLGCGCGVVGILAAKQIGAEKVVMYFWQKSEATVNRKKKRKTSR